MPPRLKSTAVVAFIILVLYLVYSQSYTPSFYGGAEHVVDVLKGNLGVGYEGEVAIPNGADATKTSDGVPTYTPNPHWQSPQPPVVGGAQLPAAITNVPGAPALPPTLQLPGRPPFSRHPRPPRPSELQQPALVPTTPPEVLEVQPPPPAATQAVSEDGQSLGAPAKIPAEADHPAVEGSPYVDAIPNGKPVTNGEGQLQDQFRTESEALDSSADAGAIYGTTLNDLTAIGTHDTSASAALTPTEFWSSYSDQRPYTFNPYPEYNGQAWKAKNKGLFKPCFGPRGEVADLRAYSGHPKVFTRPSIGSYIPLKIDSNLCFERETRLGPYGFVEGAESEPVKSQSATDESAVDESTDAESADEEGSIDELEKRGDWDKVDWGLLQRQCLKKNANRYAPVFRHKKEKLDKAGTAVSSQEDNNTGKIRRLDTIQDEVEEDEGEPTPVEVFDDEEKQMNHPKYTTPAVTTEYKEAEALKYAMLKIPSDGGEDESPDTQKDEEEVDETQQTPPIEVFDDENKQGKHPKYKAPVVTEEHKEAQALKYATPKIPSDGGESPNSHKVHVTSTDEKLAAHTQTTQEKTEEKSRTAFLVRTYVGQKFTENDKQNIRALVSELCLRSGGEYELYILAQVKDDAIPIWSDSSAYQKVVQESIPQEFWNLTILWNDSQMKELYPLIPAEVNNVHQSQWLSVQKFAQDHPEFEYVWNWEFDTRYTGQYYDLLEKLDIFAEAVPRRYLWERNERYYIPHFHGSYQQFMKTVEKLADSDTIWGPPLSPNVAPIGPTRPSSDPSDDTDNWGAGEPADYISLAPIFNPVGTTWPGRDDVWGYDSVETPRRATIGTTSRCSKKLLKAMHAENLRGNHVSSEMTPQTVSLLHSLKAVFAPIPMYFDKPWQGALLDKFFNPGPKRVSGSTEESPFSWGKESRFEGSTWYYRADTPMRLYNNWLGWEDHGIGGAEWEKEHGRICLPPMLLHPIKDVVNHGPGYSSELPLPYQ